MSKRRLAPYDRRSVMAGKRRAFNALREVRQHYERGSQVDVALAAVRWNLMREFDELIKACK